MTDLSGWGNERDRVWMALRRAVEWCVADVPDEDTGLKKIKQLLSQRPYRQIYRALSANIGPEDVEWHTLFLYYLARAGATEAIADITPFLDSKDEEAFTYAILSLAWLHQDKGFDMIERICEGEHADILTMLPDWHFEDDLRLIDHPRAAAIVEKYFSMPGAGQDRTGGNSKTLFDHLRFREYSQAKQNCVRDVFKDLQWHKITGYQLAQVKSEGDYDWSDWEDAPIILELGDSQVAVCWTRFDKLAIETDPERLQAILADRSFENPEEGVYMRWVSSGHVVLDQVVGECIVSVSLGAGAMSVPVTSEKKVWNNLLLHSDSGRTLNIYNALDENAIELIEGETQLETLRCV